MKALRGNRRPLSISASDVFDNGVESWRVLETYAKPCCLGLSGSCLR